MTATTARELSQRITDFVAERTEAIVTRFLPGFVIPGFFCGHRRAGFAEGPNLVFALAQLHTLGVKEIAGTPIDRAIATILHGIDGPGTDTFYSFFVADTLLAFGPFENNPLLAGFSAAERENIRVATDTTGIYDPETKWLRGWANNYWGVLARCEFERQRLGILPDDALLRLSVEQLQKLLFQNPLGFFDDGRDQRGRYDIYSADVQLFCEPMWPLFDQAKLAFNLCEHTRLIETIVMENGASFVFGRSIGVLSVCLTMEFLAMSLAHGLASDPARSLELIRHAFEAFTGWFEDDLINSHRRGNTEGYRSIHRVLQMTIDCLGKVAYAAEQLRAVSVQGASKTLLFPDRDEWIAFDSRHAGVWMFRNEHLAFQFALTEGDNSDYAPWWRSPGLLETPISSPMFCGVPRIAKGKSEFTIRGLPTQVEKSPSAMRITYDHFLSVNDGKNTTFNGKRTASYRVEGDTLFVDEHLVFDEIPDAISWFMPESTRPLDVTFTSAQPFHHDTVAIEGMPDWRSAWGGLKTLYQAHFEPAREVRFSCTIRLAGD